MKNCLFLLFCFVLLAGCQREPAGFDNVLIYPQSKALKPFEVTDASGNSFSKENLKGHWSLVFLGYTFCPDICPTTLTDLNRIYPQLKSISQEIQVILLSADPQRDSAQRLKSYIEFFNPEFIALRAPHTSLLPLTRNLGLVYAMHGEAENYLINHSASLVLIDPNGDIRAMIKPSFEQTPASVDFAQIPAVLKSLVN